MINKSLKVKNFRGKRSFERRKNKTRKEESFKRKGEGKINGPLFYLATSKCKKVHL